MKLVIATDELAVLAAEIRAFAMARRQALLMEVAYIEKRYGLKPRSCSDCPLHR